MQHIVQIAFEFDDEAVKRHIESNAEREIISKLETDVRNHLFEKHFQRFRVPEGKETLSAWTEARFDAFLDAHKAEIIQAAGEYLGAKLARTKAGKAALERAASQ